jgi:hypothetical protein
MAPQCGARNGPGVLTSSGRWERTEAEGCEAKARCEVRYLLCLPLSEWYRACHHFMPATHWTLVDHMCFRHASRSAPPSKRFSCHPSRVTSLQVSPLTFASTLRPIAARAGRWCRSSFWPCARILITLPFGWPVTAPHRDSPTAFCLGLGTALSAQWFVRGSTATRLPLLWLFLASASHPVLDLLVGAHPVPLLWPFGAEVAATVGVLPSAGALALDNYFLWRNLLIEMGVLLPVFALCAAVCRRTSIKRIAVWTACIAPAWAGFLFWSLRLAR